MTHEENAGIGEQALNKVAEIGLSSQLEEAESIDIDIHGDLLKLVQGEADSISLKGKGLITPQDLRLEELELQTDNIAVNLLNAALGKLELTHAADASMRVVVTADDLNRALNSHYLRNLLQHLEIQVENQVIAIELQQAECSLPGNDQVALKAQMLAHLADKTQPTTGKTQPVAMRVVLKSKAGGQYITFKEGEYLDDKDLPLDLTAALLVKITEWLNQRSFQYEDISLYLRRLEVEKDKVSIWLKAHIEQIPS